MAASVEKLKQKEKKEPVIEAKEIQQEKKEPVIQLSKSDLTDIIQNVVTEMLDKREKK
ncbi:unnamed protein product [marine sediment metagenome]|uniref:Uncharacterized protein n=1 Tax=marine sediment metagenome TaxID=412755 RepID=X1I219_9ZZZZ